MATATLTKPAAKGGSFLLESPQPGDIFTPADLTDDQKLIGQTAEEFVLKEVFPFIKELENKKAGLMAELVKKGGEVGLMGGGVPEEYGGAGLDKISTTVLTEKLSIYGGFAVTHGAHAGIGTLPIVYFGTEAQKKKYLPKLATGEWIGAYCLSEPQAGSDAQNSLTRAELNAQGTHYILNGQKMWITNGGFADVYLVFAKIDGEKFTAFIVERTFPGFKPGNEEHKMGIHGSSTTPIFLENCMVPKENLLHEIGRGHIVAFNILNAGRFTLGASCVGGSKHVLMTSSKYAKERKAFGKQIGDFGLMKEKLAEMAIQIFAVESMVYRSAGNIEAAMAAASGSGDKIQNTMKVLEEYAIESSIAKVYGSEMLDFVVDEAVQIFGGYGFHEDYPVCRAYRDSRINRIFEGTNEINRMLIIQMLMKRAMGGQLPLIPAAMKLADEILAGPSFEEAPEGVLAGEARVVANSKKMFLQAAGGAVQKFREKLADEQELIGALSNVVMEIYAMESCMLRAQKAAATKGEPASQNMIDSARVFINDAAERVEHEAKRAIAAIHEGDMLTTQMAVLKRFAKRAPVDTIALRRRVAAAIQSQDRYPLEGR
ncbi:MAG: acyl-CoA dehydrogenase [Acidobacteria bacterium]|nr:MAG: acyl-CoA dehydrogenase [Acidobacteriota bacterium]PYU65722.1 MAG: acyl-CoA dehydrogenase [Acidobacteriota bacterium]PYU70632.1 MAG: acyl-CoA dehydrogenase [Acidobacteriota bacterium]